MRGWAEGTVHGGAAAAVGRGAWGALLACAAEREPLSLPSTYLSVLEAMISAGVVRIVPETAHV